MAARARARQLDLDLARRTPHGWGGRRAGAGRPRRKASDAPGGRLSHPHTPRATLSPRHPVHVVLRLTPDVGRLRRHRAYLALRHALLTSLARADFRVVHLSIQGHHVHLVCEADDHRALSCGVRGLSISAARHLNAAISVDRGLPRRRRGRVFVDRYHATQLRSPTQVRHALAYVLNNWRRHREDHAPRARRARVDPYSSGVAFPGWLGRAGVPFAWPRGYLPLPVAYPTTWLLTTGWRRAGPDLAMHHVPGPS